MQGELPLLVYGVLGRRLEAMRPEGCAIQYAGKISFWMLGCSSRAAEARCGPGDRCMGCLQLKARENSWVEVPLPYLSSPLICRCVSASSTARSAA